MDSSDITKETNSGFKVPDSEPSASDSKAGSSNRGEPQQPEPSRSAAIAAAVQFRSASLRSLAGSLAVHGVVIAILASIVLPALTRGHRDLKINASLQSDLAADQNVESMVTVDVQRGAEGDPVTVSTEVSPDVPSPTTTVSDSRTMKLQPLGTRVSLIEQLDLSDDFLMKDIEEGMKTFGMYETAGETRVQQAQGAAEIATSVKGDLLSIAREGDSRVVWLLDQSVSMQKDLKILAEGLLGTLEQIEKDDTSRMSHTVVAFGNKVRQIGRLTNRGRAVAEAIYNLPEDPSGTELTFEAVEWCVRNFFGDRRGPRQRLIVLWTDESGDDYLRLENTIQLCRFHGVRVDVVGPSAVLGAQTGYSRYAVPDDPYNRVYYLPVHRGPDTGFPQKLQLGYWHRGVPQTYNESVQGPYSGTSPRWHGGSNLDGMLSGFSPYALTRLSKQTGGRYVMYDRPGDRAPFDLEEIRDYLPDYRSLPEIERDLGSHPLRLLVLASAQSTWNSRELHRTEPRLNHRPDFAGQLHQPYLTGRLIPRLKQDIREAQRDLAAVERALYPYFVGSVMRGFQPDPGASGIRDTDPSGDSSSNKMAGTDRESTDESESTSSTKDGPPDESPEESPIVEQSGNELTERVNETLLEQIYREEPSRRWRAWNDLNLGRLLIISVRLHEYLIVARQILQNPSAINNQYNSLTMFPTETLRGGSISQQRLAIARRLLFRCQTENAGTPWEVMAAREQKHPVGLDVRTRFIPRPTQPRVPVRRSPPPPPPPLPRL